jgi:hypothetical protein
LSIKQAPGSPPGFTVSSPAAWRFFCRQILPGKSDLAGKNCLPGKNCPAKLVFY